MLKKSKKIIVVVIIEIVLILSSFVVYAYFTARASKTNNVRLGFNKIEVLENYDPPIAMEKGISFTKEPYVVNSGDVDCYVRLKVAVSDSRIEKGLTIDYNTEDFSYSSEDGYWYYKSVLKPGEQTVPIFSTVSIAEDADDLVLDGFDIYVYAESVQTVDDIENDVGKTVEEKMEAVWNYFQS